MSEKLLKLVKRLHDAALDLYHQPARSHVAVDRSDLRDIVEDWRRLGSENLAERLEIVRLKAENEALRTVGRQMVKGIDDWNASMESIIGKQVGYHWPALEEMRDLSKGDQS